jgi:hypothetical protein
LTQVVAAPHAVVVSPPSGFADVGHCYTTSDERQFRLGADKQEDALKAVRALLDTLPWGRDIYRAHNLSQIFSAFDYDIEIDQDGDIIDLDFFGEKLTGDEMKLWQVIAPFVDVGSYIQCSGERGDVWRWVFNGTTCREIYPEVTWD